MMAVCERPIQGTSMFKRLSRGEGSVVGSCLGIGGAHLAIGVYRLVIQDGLGAMLSPRMWAPLLLCGLSLSMSVFLLRRLGERGGHTIAAGWLALAVCIFLPPCALDALESLGATPRGPMYASLTNLLLAMISTCLGLTIVLRWVRWQE